MARVRTGARTWLKLMRRCMLLYYGPYMEQGLKQILGTDEGTDIFANASVIMGQIKEAVANDNAFNAVDDIPEAPGDEDLTTV